MMIDDAMLSSRPTTVMHQLGAQSRVPLFNGRWLLDQLAETQVVLWAPAISHPVAAQAVLRAAMHRRAVVGFTMAPPSASAEELRKEYAPGSFFQMVVGSAEKLDRLPPFFLHVQEPALSEASGPAFEAVRSHLAACLESGFTSFGIDLTSCSAAELLPLASSLLTPVLDLELGVVLRLHAAGAGPGWASGVAATVLSLNREGINSDLVLLPGPDQIGEEAFSLVQQVSPLIAPAGVAWSTIPRSFQKRLLDAPDTPIKSVLACDRLARLKPAALDADGLERWEAMAYVEAIEQIDILRARFSADALLRTVEPA